MDLCNQMWAEEGMSPSLPQGVKGGNLENIVQSNSALCQEYDSTKPKHVYVAG